MLASLQLACSGSSEEVSSPSSSSSVLSAPAGGLASPPLMVGGHEHVPLTSVPTLASALLGRNRSPFREQHEEDEGRVIMTQQHIHAVLASLAQKFEASGAVGAGWRSPPPTRRHRRSASQMESPSSSSSSSSASSSSAASASSLTSDAGETPSRKRRRTTRTKSASSASDHPHHQSDGDHHQQGQEEGTTKRRRRSSKKESKVARQSSVDCGDEGQAEASTRRRKGRRERKAATLTQPQQQQHQLQPSGQDERREHEDGAPGMHQGAMVVEQQLQRPRPTASIAFLLNDEDSFDSATSEFGGFAFEVAPQPSPTPARPASLGSSASPPPTSPPSYPFPCHVMERRAAYAAH